MSKIIHAIVHTCIENTICFDIISKDGITTDIFEINKANGLFVKCSINVREIKSLIPAILRSVSIAKNLDYYQNKICHEISSISDTERIKLTLQKLRVIIIALFLKLNKLLIEIKTNTLSELSHDIEEWNKNSEETLIITSSILVNYEQRKTNIQNLDTLGTQSIVIAATNHPELLDSAIWRRFSYRIELGFPSQMLRQGMWENSLAPLKFTDKEIEMLVDLSDGFSGADIQEVCIRLRRKQIVEKSLPKFQDAFAALKNISMQGASNRKNFLSKIQNKDEETIVKALRKRNPKLYSHTAIAELLGFSKSTAFRLSK